MAEKVIRDFTRRSGITAETGLNAFEVPGEVGPSGHPVIRNRCVDGQTGAGSNMANERSDGQLGSIPYGARRRMVYYQRWNILPNKPRPDRWLVTGPSEIHSTNWGIDQAPVMPEISPTDRFRFNTPLSKYGNWTDYSDDNPNTPDGFPIVLGKWYKFEVSVKYTNNGYLKVWVDGQLIWDERGRIAADDSASGYWKYANYRNAQISGVSEYDISGGMIYEPVDDASGQLPVFNTPAPPPLSVKILNPLTGYELPGTIKTQVEIVGSVVKSQLLFNDIVAYERTAAPFFDVDPPFTLDPALVPDGTYTVKAVVYNASGAKAEDVVVGVVVKRPTPPPPPPVSLEKADYDAGMADLVRVKNRLEALYNYYTAASLKTDLLEAINAQIRAIESFSKLL